MPGLIELTAISPSILLEIRYAGANNFTGKRIYSSARCLLQTVTAKRLHRVQMSLQKRGLGLKVFDGYRPLSAQKILWEVCPNTDYVADPKVGSKHNRGTAVDLTLVDRRGSELAMPSGFDEMNEKAHHSYQGGDPRALEHRKILFEAMQQEGFIPYPLEWWHYDDPDWERYPILDVPL